MGHIYLLHFSCPLCNICNYNNPNATLEIRHYFGYVDSIDESLELYSHCSRRQICDSRINKKANYKIAGSWRGNYGLMVRLNTHGNFKHKCSICKDEKLLKNKVL